MTDVDHNHHNGRITPHNTALFLSEWAEMHTYAFYVCYGIPSPLLCGCTICSACLLIIASRRNASAWVKNLSPPEDIRAKRVTNQEAITSKKKCLTSGVSDQSSARSTLHVVAVVGP